MIRYIFNKIKENYALIILKDEFDFSANNGLISEDPGKISQSILKEFKINLKASDKDFLSFQSGYTIAICALGNFVNTLDLKDKRIFSYLSVASSMIVKFMTSDEYLRVDEVEKDLIDIAKDSILYKMSKVGMFDKSLFPDADILPEDEFQLAVIYFRINENKDGYQWLKKSFNNGYWRSLELIYLVYTDGIGVKKDDVKAYAYLNLYISILSALEDVSGFKELLRKISLEMPKEDVEKAEDLSKEFLTKYMMKELYLD